MNAVHIAVLLAAALAACVTVQQPSATADPGPPPAPADGAPEAGAIVVERGSAVDAGFAPPDPIVAGGAYLMQCVTSIHDRFGDRIPPLRFRTEVAATRSAMSATLAALASDAADGSRTVGESTLASGTIDGDGAFRISIAALDYPALASGGEPLSLADVSLGGTYLPRAQSCARIDSGRMTAPADEAQHLDPTMSRCTFARLLPGDALPALTDGSDGCP